MVIFYTFDLIGPKYKNRGLVIRRILFYAHQNVVFGNNFLAIFKEMLKNSPPLMASKKTKKTYFSKKI